jgi:hypothetical protein
VPSTSYRCYFLSGDSIVDVADIEADDDAAALIEASRRLDESSYRSIEIWSGGRKLSLLSRPEPPPGF